MATTLSSQASEDAFLDAERRPLSLDHPSPGVVQILDTRFQQPGQQGRIMPPSPPPGFTDPPMGAAVVWSCKVWGRVWVRLSADGSKAHGPRLEMQLVDDGHPSVRQAAAESVAEDTDARGPNDGFLYSGVGAGAPVPSNRIPASISDAIQTQKVVPLSGKVGMTPTPVTLAMGAITTEAGSAAFSGAPPGNIPRDSGPSADLAMALDKGAGILVTFRPSPAVHDDLSAEQQQEQGATPPEAARLALVRALQCKLAECEALLQRGM